MNYERRVYDNKNGDCNTYEFVFNICVSIHAIFMSIMVCLLLIIDSFSAHW
jgi:hypothetical protein